MSSLRKTVLVLGAGFTRAFLPKAPLMVDDYGGDILLEEFQRFPHAKAILAEELARNTGRKIDVERLLTRLYGLMPYDFQSDAQKELAVLYSAVVKAFMARLESSKDERPHSDELKRFAGFCVTNDVTCITFNYDDVLDEALQDVEGIGTKRRVPLGERYWHPDGGYGFFCRPSATTVRDVYHFMDKTSMLLLKLHGSINWRARAGYPRPYSIDAILHHESWLRYILGDEVADGAIEFHLESEPFIVPPILSKSTIVEQPVLRVVWSRAREELSRAGEVVFVGYSLPRTDIASAFLFSEAIQPATNVSVVNHVGTGASRRRLEETYLETLPNVRLEFQYRDALDWSQEFASR